MKYRREVDGLRALAVLPVIFYHAGNRYFRAGFLGVDVFFVISGYLITTLIVEGIENGTFSILNFYERRARRILPALFVVLGICIPAAYYLMLPDDLENFGQSLVATVAFSNNILLFLTSGYWDAGTELKPLLHTWSLGVEEQYYLVAPLVVFAVVRYRKAWLHWLFLLIFVSSLALSEYSSIKATSFNFLFIFTRAWELAAGAFVATSIRRGTLERYRAYSGFLSWIGAALIIASFLAFTPVTPHPSLLTLVPVLGVCMMVAFASEANTVGKVLSLPVFVGIGLLSYSAYLWHQPLFAFARIVSLEEPESYKLTALVPIVFLLSYLSWRFVEKPTRSGLTISNRAFFPAVVMIAVSIVGVGTYWLVSATAEPYSGRAENMAYNEQVRQRFGLKAFPPKSEKRNILVVGDSFGRDFINAGLENNYFAKDNVIYFSELQFAACSKVHPAGGPEGSRLLQNSDFILFVFDFAGSEPQCLANRLEEITRLSSARIIVVGPKNFGWNNNPLKMVPRESRPGFRVPVSKLVVQRNERGKNLFPKSIYVDSIGMIANGEGKVPVFTPDKKFISQDAKHFTKFGAKYIGHILFSHPLLVDLTMQPTSNR